MIAGCLGVRLVRTVLAGIGLIHQIRVLPLSVDTSGVYFTFLYLAKHETGSGRRSASDREGARTHGARRSICPESVPDRPGPGA
jgi:hypothetical protein